MPRIPEYRSSITMPHLKFRFLHCRGTLGVVGLPRKKKCTAIDANTAKAVLFAVSIHPYTVQHTLYLYLEPDIYKLVNKLD